MSVGIDLNFQYIVAPELPIELDDVVKLIKDNADEIQTRRADGDLYACACTSFSAVGRMVIRTRRSTIP